MFSILRVLSYTSIHIVLISQNAQKSHFSFKTSCHQYTTNYDVDVEKYIPTTFFSILFAHRVLHTVWRHPRSNFAYFSIQGMNDIVNLLIPTSLPTIIDMSILIKCQSPIVADWYLARYLSIIHDYFATYYSYYIIGNYHGGHFSPLDITTKLVNSQTCLKALRHVSIQFYSTIMLIQQDPPLKLME